MAEPENPTPEPPPENPTPEERTFSQKDVDKIAGNRAKEAAKTAEAAAYQKLLEDLGAESLDELKEGYQGFKTVQEETQTEAEKAKAEAERFKAERDEAKAATEAANKLAEERHIKAELRLELIGEGARKDRLAKIIRDADLSEVEIEDEEVKNLAPVVTALKTEYPEWFGTTTQDIPGSPPAGDPSQLTEEKRKEQAEIASRQVRNLF